MCCTLLDVPEIDKPHHITCRHYAAGVGCTIHETRPPCCRPFQCHWSLLPHLPDDWRPDLVHFILWTQDAKQVIVEVDPDYADAWLKEPVHSVLRSWSGPQGLEVLVRVGPRMFMMFPEADIDMGEQQEDKIIDYGYRLLFNGRREPFARFIDPPTT